MIKDKQKIAFLEQLKKNPVIQVACGRTGISRSTYYRWRRESLQFAKASEEAIGEGELMFSELSESQLFSLIKEKHFQSISLYLKTHNPKYSSKIEILGDSEIIDEKLTPRQRAVIRAALKLDKERKKPYVSKKKQKKKDKRA